MKRFRDFLKEEFKDKGLEKKFYSELESGRIAGEIAFYREKAGLTQKALADKVGTSQSAIARLENPNYKGYSIKLLRKIADIFDLELVVTYREKGSTRYEKMAPTIIHVTSTVWQNKKDGYKFQKSPDAMSLKKQQEGVA